MRNQRKIQETEKVSDQNMFCNSGRNLREKRKKLSKRRKPEGSSGNPPDIVTVAQRSYIFTYMDIKDS